ncbi:MAG: phospholipase D-like domain-containing protein, partial [Janthinobacterium lividum]
MVTLHPKQIGVRDGDVSRTTLERLNPGIGDTESLRVIREGRPKPRDHGQALSRLQCIAGRDKGSAVLENWHWLGAGLVFVLQIVFIIRALLRPDRQPASRLAWVAIIGALPLLGIIAYLLLGETNPGGTIVKRIEAAARHVPVPGRTDDGLIDVEQEYELPPRVVPIFRMGQSINGYPPMGGNRAQLMADSNAAIEAIVADIDAAQAHVHICFYIWLADNNGTKVAQALMRAATRGVTCRVMADDLGSRRLIRGTLWREMKDAGVRLVHALPIGNVLTTPLHGRFDMRNHRKIVIVDNRVTFCGSQNCADPEFRV